MFYAEAKLLRSICRELPMSCRTVVPRSGPAPLLTDSHSALPYLTLHLWPHFSKQCDFLTRSSLGKSEASIIQHCLKQVNFETRGCTGCVCVSSWEIRKNLFCFCVVTSNYTPRGGKNVFFYYHQTFYYTLVDSCATSFRLSNVFFPYAHELSKNSPCQFAVVKIQALVLGELDTEKCQIQTQCLFLCSLLSPFLLHMMA